MARYGAYLGAGAAFVKRKARRRSHRLRAGDAGGLERGEKARVGVKGLEDRIAQKERQEGRALDRGFFEHRRGGLIVADVGERYGDLRKLFSRTIRDQLIDFLARLFSPKLPITPLKEMGF